MSRRRIRAQHRTTSHLPITHSTVHPPPFSCARSPPPHDSHRRLFLCVCVRARSYRPRDLCPATLTFEPSSGLTSATAPTPGCASPVQSSPANHPAAHTTHILYYSALSCSSRLLVSCSERVVFEPFAHLVVAVAYPFANFTDCTCLAMSV